MALVEHGALGGTCVNVGCVPKKVMWNTAFIKEIIEFAPHYGFAKSEPKLDFSVIKQKRDNYVKRCVHLPMQFAFPSSAWSFLLLLCVVWLHSKRNAGWQPSI